MFTYIHGLQLLETVPFLHTTNSLTGEATENVITHCLHNFSMFSVPDQIKTDNGSGYCSQASEMFC
jgi:hypothetical protein